MGMSRFHAAASRGMMPRCVMLELDADFPDPRMFGPFRWRVDLPQLSNAEAEDLAQRMQRP